MSTPTADEIRDAAILLGKFAAVLERKNLQGTGEHIALTESAKFLRSLVRDSEPTYVQDRNRGNLDMADTCCATHNTARFPLLIVCTTCGNKRCPKATHCANECTGSNEQGQKGSRFA